MRRLFALLAAPAAVSATILAAQGCTDQTNDFPSSDAAPFDSSKPDSAEDAASDGGGDAGGDAACPSSWLVAPTVDPVLAVPDGGVVALHASATGTQDYACSQVAIDGGAGYAWVFSGPEADLHDCNGVAIGKHFAAGGDAGAPEWMTMADSSFVIAHKIAAETPDGGASAIPWLLLQAVDHGGSGVLSTVTYVERVDTAGGLAPSTGCDTGTVGATQKVSYTAEYYFFTP